jgi:hypothetical protein
MTRSIRSIVLISIVLAILACGLPSRTNILQPTPASPSLTSSAQPKEPLPISLTEALVAGVEAGRWTESGGIVTALRYLAGELSEQEVFGAEAPTSVEGTGVVRRAQAYLAAASNTDGREEMTRLLAILIPSRQALQDLSEPASAADASVPGLAIPAKRPASQEEVSCRLLWSTGYSEPIICFRYHERVIDGRTHRVYAPRDWPAGDPRRALIDEALAALEDSLSLYNRYGPAPVLSTDIVFTDLPFLDRTVRRPSVMAVAADDVSDGRCHVGVFPSAGTSGLSALKQTIAHELFHCYQYTNFLAKTVSLPEEVNGWWVEGTAEFFGSVVYPAGNDEWRYAPAFDESSTYTPMHQMSYEAYLLFQYLAVQQGQGTEGVLEIIRDMPSAGGGAEQRDALAAVAGIDNAFHEFGRAYLDRKLIDPGGGFTPVNPQPGEGYSFAAGSNREELASEGFWLDRYRLTFADRVRFETTTEEDEGEGRLSARPARSPGEWGQVPATLNTACDDGEYMVLVTSTIPTAGTPRTFTVAASGEDVREDLECDECVVGTWVLDNTSYLAHLGGLWPFVIGQMPSYGLDTEGAEAHPTGVFGEMTIKFNADGTASGGQEGWGVAGEGTKDGVTIQTQMTYTGTGEAAWRIERDEAGELQVLFFEEGTFDIIGQMVFQGMPLSPLPTGGSNDPIFLSTPQPFLCSNTTLTYYADDPLGPIVFTRAAPESSSP